MSGTPCSQPTRNRKASTRRGPGRLNIWLPSTSATRPPRTAGRPATQGCAAKAAHSARVRASGRPPDALRSAVAADEVVRRVHGGREPAHGPARVRAAPDRVPHPHHVREHVPHRVRVEADHGGDRVERAHDAAHGAEVDRADLAEILRQHHVGAQVREPRGVERVEAAVGSQRRADLRVDLARARVGARALARQRRKRLDAGRPVALVAAPDQQVERADRADDLGRGREQADDAHPAMLAGTASGGPRPGENGGRTARDGAPPPPCG